MNIKLSNSEKTDLIYELLNLLLLDFNENIDDILSDQVLTREGIRLLSKSEKIDVIYGLSNLLPKDVLISILLDFNESIDDLINILTGQVLFLKWMDKVSPTPEGFELNLVSFKGVYSYKSDLKIWYFEKNYLYLYS